MAAAVAAAGEGELTGPDSSGDVDAAAATADFTTPARTPRCSASPCLSAQTSPLLSSRKSGPSVVPTPPRLQKKKKDEDLSPLDELIAILETGSEPEWKKTELQGAAAAAAAADAAAADSSAAEPHAQGVVVSYEKLQRDVTDANRAAFDQFLGQLRTVFVNDGTEAEGDNIARNITAMKAFLAEQSRLTREGGAPISPAATRLYERFVDSSHRVTADQIKTACLPERRSPAHASKGDPAAAAAAAPAPAPAAATTASVTAASPAAATHAGASRCSSVVSGSADGLAAATAAAAATSTTTASPATAPSGGGGGGGGGAAAACAASSHGGKKTRHIRSDSLSLAVPPLRDLSSPEFVAFVASFGQMEAAMWEDIRTVAVDASVKPDERASKLVEIVLRDGRTAWSGVYHQVEVFKAVSQEHIDLQTQLADVTEECKRLREENLLNSAFLAGDLAQGLEDEIEGLKEGVLRGKEVLQEVNAAIERAAHERAAREDEARAVFNRMAAAKDVLQALHLQAADCGALLPRGLAERSAALASEADREQVRLQPDCGAPSGKRCPACLQVSTLSPFCPATGGVHKRDASYPDRAGAPSPGGAADGGASWGGQSIGQAAAAAPAPKKEGRGKDGGGAADAAAAAPSPTAASVRPITRLKAKKGADASVALAALAAAVAARCVGEECPCGTSMVLYTAVARRPEVPKAAKKRVAGAARRSSVGGAGGRKGQSGGASLPEIRDGSSVSNASMSFRSSATHDDADVLGLRDLALRDEELTEAEAHAFSGFVREYVNLLLSSSFTPGDLAALCSSVAGTMGAFAKNVAGLKKVAREMLGLRDLAGGGGGGGGGGGSGEAKRGSSRIRSSTRVQRESYLGT